MYNENIWKLRTGFTSRVGLLSPVMLSEGVNKGRITLERMVEVCCENPAKIFGLYPKKGALQVGSDADMVLVDLDKEVTLEKKHLFTRSGWSIAEGHTFKGWPVMTILRGRSSRSGRRIRTARSSPVNRWASTSPVYSDSRTTPSRTAPPRPSGPRFRLGEPGAGG
jgi:dihydroorotase-like cyclic amidohydrolase